jgi:arsenate reductase
MSAHLSVLAAAGLVHGERQSRSIIYRASLPRLRDVTLYLVQDCCGGRPEICAPLIDTFTPCCTPKRSSPIMAEDRPYNVLFLCTGNSARSILGEAFLNHVADGQFRAYSAGSYPKGQVNPLALAVLHEAGIPTEGLRSKSWDEFTGPDAPHMDFVFTVCDDAAGEVCPIWPGHPMTAHWGIEDPAAVEGTEFQKHAAFLEAFRFMRNRISAFTSLPHRSIDRMVLQSKLHEIGSLDGATMKAGDAA